MISLPVCALLSVSGQLTTLIQKTGHPVLTALALSIPILAGLIALVSSLVTANRTAKAQAITKAAELALLGEDSEHVVNRARVVAHLYGDLLPKDFVQRVAELNSEEVGKIVTPYVADLKKR